MSSIVHSRILYPAVAALICVACDPEEPLAIGLSAQDVVLTPGGQTEIGIGIHNGLSEPISLELSELPPGIDAKLSETPTKREWVVLTLTSSPKSLQQEFKVKVTARFKAFTASATMKVHVEVPGPVSPGVPEYAPGVDGVTKTLTIDGQELVYQVIDGKAIVGGDIVLGDALELERSQGEEAFRSSTCNFGFDNGLFCARWTDGIIGYGFQDDWGDEDENDRMKLLIEDAIDTWEAETGIRFVRRGSGERIVFHDGDGCSSNVGRAPITGLEPQGVTLNNEGCDEPEVILHEIGHAIGLFHEVARNDRNDHVVVDFGRVESGRIGNFFQTGEFGRDRGAYDYTSVMHYRPWAWALDMEACQAGNIAECTIKPPCWNEGDDCVNPPEFDAVWEDGGVSEGDILGVYSLYPPQFTIEGAEDFDSGDVFSLSLSFSTPAPRADRIQWTTSRAPGVLGDGAYLQLRAADVPPGLNVIRADVMVAGQSVASRSISLFLWNTAPVVSVTANNGRFEQALGQPFTVSATVDDEEDGHCPEPGCTYAWSPSPANDFGATANFVFDTPGEATIIVDVEDRGGAIGQGSLTVDVVNTAPTAEIVRPADDIAIHQATVVEFEGRGMDPNDPSGRLPCAALEWSSSNTFDMFFPDPSGQCAPLFSPTGGGGFRTISLVATDPQGESHTDTVHVTVSYCTDGCAPTALLTVSDHPLGSDVYFVRSPMQFLLEFGSVEAPADSPITYELTIERPGSSTYTLASGTVEVPYPAATIPVNAQWTPIDDIGTWTNCTSEFRDWTLVLRATDSGSPSRTTTLSETITLGCNLI